MQTVDTAVSEEVEKYKFPSQVLSVVERSCTVNPLRYTEIF